MMKLSANKFAQLLKTDQQGLADYSYKYGKPSKARIESAGKVVAISFIIVVL